MARINLVDPQTASDETKPLLDAVHAQLGAVPNGFRALANSPRALRGALGLLRELAGGSLSAATRERIALVTAERNRCDYCLAAHTTLARAAGLSESDIAAARVGTARDSKTAAALRFAQAVVDGRGAVPASDVAALRQAGYSDGELVEIISTVAFNVLTNYLNKAAEVDLDFPAAPPLSAAA